MSNDTSPDSDKFFCGIDTPIKKTLEAGFGNVLYIKGWCFHTKHGIKELRIRVGSRSRRVFNLGLPRTDVFHNFLEYYYSLRSGFWGVVPIERIEKEEKVELAVEAVLNNGTRVLEKFGDIILMPGNGLLGDMGEKREKVRERIESLKKDRSGPHVVICMATYNPAKEFFEMQIQSIREQSYKNWSCIINDDCSTPFVYRQILDVIGNDKRFLVFRNAKNLGFYCNFEQALKLVPQEADFVALSDQDDFWYKKKLERCISEFDHETTLVYSDMRIVDHEGKCISSTFWITRKNYYKELDYLILANTVTGAASVFRRQLLDHILPFPEKFDGSFHDHWIACVANVAGKIKYIDEPLYDFYQHSGNVIGHASFDRGGIRKFLKGLKEFSKPNTLKARMFYLRYVYNVDVARLMTTAFCLLLRFKDMESKKKRAVFKFIHLEKSSRGMLTMKLKTLVSRKTTNNAELRLFSSFWASRIVNMSASFISKGFFKKSFKGSTFEILSRHYSYEDVKAKIAPLSLEILKKRSEQINFLIPSIDFRYFFGGYIAKFNFAKKLVNEGYAVRVILVDQASLDVEACRNEIKKYPGLENFFDLVTIVCALERGKKIPVSSQDVFIATTWWTAHIAHYAARQLGTKGFMYFIQEFEPFIFPRGTYYALAEQTYRFPHYAIFSTKFLQEYFRSNRIGVYEGRPLEEGDNRALYFENAIRKFDVNLSFIQKRKTKKLVFYARPEAHAARNMFDLGMIALQEAINRGMFKPEDLEFYGIGSVSTEKFYPLTEDVNLIMLPKVSLTEYYEMLPKFDLGLCLMHTPHPSLPPLEMAAAGIIVVTTTCCNKTKEKLKKISKNIIGVDPTIDDIVDGLKLALSLVDDYEWRIEGASVNWANSWEETFDEERITKIKGYIYRLSHNF